MALREKKRVLAANAAFYAAFRTGDLAAMERVWSHRENVGLFHPNARGVEGRAAVMRSWRAVLVDTPPPEIFPVEPLVILCSGTAMVVCDEVVGNARMIATNIFADEDGAWRLVHHQATRLRASASGSGSDSGKRSTREQGDG